MIFYMNGGRGGGDSITQHLKSHQICRISDRRLICKALSSLACCVALCRDCFYHRGDAVTSLSMDL